MNFIATVVIPAFERIEALEMAIQSVLSQKGSEKVEIIVIDDNSRVALTPTNLREIDKLVRNQSNVGAAVSRNIGIKMALGDIIYLLDSDDRFVNRDFIEDHNKVHKTRNIYYCDVISQNYKSKYPAKINRENYFNYIFFKYPYITQTSSLVFSKETSFLFDESLPKHQDWDFIFYNAFTRNRKAQKIEGCVFFDRSDKKSLSRKPGTEKSEVWYRKVLNDENVSTSDKEYLSFYLFAQNINIITLFKNTAYYYRKNKTSLIFPFKVLIKRWFLRR